MTPVADMEERISLLRELGRVAGRLLMNHYGQVSDYELKGSVDVVTRADREVEQVCVERIRSLFPRDAVLAEEGGAREGDSGVTWIMDPLDGTTNFAHGYPFFAFSCAVCVHDRIEAGLVEVPFMKETFYARRQGGAFLNERPIRVSAVTELKRALLVTGLPYFRSRMIDGLLAPMRRAVLHGQGLRRGGAAAVDLCYVACGRLDGYFEIGLKPWDVAAGALIVEEAGGRMSDYSGGLFDPYAAQLVASNGHIHGELLTSVVADAETAP